MSSTLSSPIVAQEPRVACLRGTGSAGRYCPLKGIIQIYEGTNTNQIQRVVIGEKVPGWQDELGRSTRSEAPVLRIFCLGGGRGDRAPGGPEVAEGEDLLQVDGDDEAGALLE